MKAARFVCLVVGLAGASCAAPIEDAAELGGNGSDDGVAATELSEQEIARYAADPDFIRVPGYLMHRSCVHEIPDGAEVRELREGTMRVRRRPTDGEEELPSCGFPSIRMKASASPSPGSISHAWIEYTETNPVVSSSLKPWFSRIAGGWGVQNEPLGSFGPATLYFFDSLQNAAGTVIIQPVLQWQPVFGGVGDWEIAAWYVSPTRALHSTPKGVSPGQQISGITKAAACNSTGSCT